MSTSLLCFPALAFPCSIFLYKFIYYYERRERRKEREKERGERE